MVGRIEVDFIIDRSHQGSFLAVAFLCLIQMFLLKCNVSEFFLQQAYLFLQFLLFIFHKIDSGMGRICVKGADFLQGKVKCSEFSEVDQSCQILICIVIVAIILSVGREKAHLPVHPDGFRAGKRRFCDFVHFHSRPLLTL